MVGRVIRTQEELNQLALDESERVFNALEAAFYSEGVEFDIVRFIGLVNGCTEFLATVTKDLFNLTDEQREQLEVNIVSLFSKHAGFSGVQVIRE